MEHMIFAHFNYIDTASYTYASLMNKIKYSTSYNFCGISHHNNEVATCMYFFLLSLHYSADNFHG